MSPPACPKGEYWMTLAALALLGAAGAARAEITQVSASALTVLHEATVNGDAASAWHALTELPR